MGQANRVNVDWRTNQGASEELLQQYTTVLVQCISSYLYIFAKTDGYALERPSWAGTRVGRLLVVE